ncbi:hypothetical protein Tco_0730031 [Tanacetum coccineum]|uniref:Uncharacterized protein n=1 Tax=Tanacetum coccineum TaxID=301880 RepID=A0ABQ4YRJ1_9ASTR
MITYLKNMEGWKHKDLKSKDFDYIKELFDKAFTRQKVDDVQETSEVDDDQEASKIKELMEIVPDEEEIAIDAIPLAVKSPRIVDWKIHKEGKKSYYQIVRADGKSQINLIILKKNIKFRGGLFGLKVFLMLFGVTAAFIDVNVAQLNLVLLENFNENYSKCLRLLVKLQLPVQSYYCCRKLLLLEEVTIASGINAAEGVNVASEEVSTAELVIKIEELRAEMNRLKEMLSLRNLNHDPGVDLYDLEGSDEGHMEIDSLTKETLDTLLIGDEVISTTPARENNEVIKFSVEDPVPIPRESEVTLVSTDLKCNTLLMGDREINVNPSDLETIDPVLDPRMFDVPLGNDDLISRSFDVTISNLLFDFDDNYSLIIDKKIDDDLCSLDPLKSISLIDESILLVTPLLDRKQICLREVERFDSFFSLTRSGDMTWVMERHSYRFPHMSLPRQVAYSPKHHVETLDYHVSKWVPPTDVDATWNATLMADVAANDWLVSQSLVRGKMAANDCKVAAGQ